MKKTIILAIVLGVLNCSGQQAISPFATKQHSNITVNTSYLNAILIDGSKNNSSNSKCPYKPITNFANTNPSAIISDSLINTSVLIKDIKYDKNSQPCYIEIHNANKTKNTVTYSQSVETSCFDFIDGIKFYLKIKSPSTEFKIISTDKEIPEQIHIKLQQVYKNIPIYGAEVMIHYTKGSFDLYNGKSYPTPNIENINPSTDNVVAVQNALTDLLKTTPIIELDETQQKLLDYESPDKELVIYYEYNTVTNPKLVWHITIRPNMVDCWEYFVDANNGNIINKYNSTLFDGPVTATGADLNGVNQTINTYLSSGKYYLYDASQTMFSSTISRIPSYPVGCIFTLDAHNSTSSTATTDITSTNNTWTPTAISAQYNAQLTYLYFKNTFGRNSIDNAGGNFISMINVPNSNGTSMDNAYWNGKYVSYGNGSSILKPLAGALDVCAHEFGHAVIQRTANLEYQYESGAINESYADIFGAMVDRTNWTIGEKIAIKSYFPSEAIRDMSNPHNGCYGSSCSYWQPANVSEQYLGSGDNGGVHKNSGIPNYAYYLIATDVTKEKAEQIYYRALTKYLTRSSRFIDLRYAVVKAAKDLYSEVEEKSCKNAFDKVGIVEVVIDTNIASLPTNPGIDKVLFVNTMSTDPNSIYIVNNTFSSLTAISKTLVNRRLSICDDGSKILFVGSDYKIYQIDLSKSSPVQTVLDANPIWRNAAISKDGTKAAFNTMSKDTLIYVRDLITNKTVKFKLYNPTTDTAIRKGGGAVYSDALEWDHSGEYILYDSYNEVKNNSGINLTYWDIGVINVWDNDKNDFADGKVNKLITGLPQNVSVGNGTFSKNSPGIISFEYVDESVPYYYVYAANLEKNISNRIFKNSGGLSYPNFSNADDKIIFHTVGVSTGKYYILTVSLNPDKISLSSLTSTIKINEGKLPVWYATGKRTLQIKSNQKELLYFSLASLNPQITGTRQDTTFTLIVPTNTDLTKLTATFSSSQKSVVKIGSLIQQSGITVNDFSKDLIYTVVAEDGSTKKFVIKVSVTNNIVESNLNILLIYPNPATTELKVNVGAFHDTPVSYKIYDIMGKVITNGLTRRLSNDGISTGSMTVDISKLTKGIYIIELTTKDGVVWSKFIKE